MANLNLVDNGIFPIIYNENGDLIDDKLDTGLSVAGTVQGEGQFMGVPSLFLRTSGCNLRCMWKDNVCDTAYSSFSPEKNIIDIQTVANIIRQNIGNILHLVITGGEPLLQATAINELLELIKDLNLVITIETNGTIFNEQLFEKTDLISVSPKLSSSNPTLEKIQEHGNTLGNHWIDKHNNERLNLTALQGIIDYCNTSNSVGCCKSYQLKFVVQTPEDVQEIKEKYLNNLTGWQSQDIYLMPEGITSDALKDKSLWIIEECIKNGFNFCPRLHVDLFGKARSV